MTDYEVKCMETWAWYKGYVHDYNEKTQTFYVTYPDDWKHPEWAKPENVRPLPEPFDLHSWYPTLGEKVECQAKAEENEPHGWWSCTIKSAENEGRYYVAFDGWDDQHNELLQKQLLRPQNRKKSLSAKNMSKTCVKVPTALVGWVSQNPSELGDLRQKQKKLVHMNFNDQNNEMILIAPKNILKHATALVELHFSRQKSLLEFAQRTKQSEQRAEMLRKRNNSAHRGSFFVHRLLTGYCCGRENINFKTVRNDARGDIYSIQIKNGFCEIRGRTQEAVDEAVRQLEVVARRLKIPRRDISFIIGKKGESIQDLRKRVDRLYKIVSWQKFPDQFENLKRRILDRETSRYHRRRQRRLEMGMKENRTKPKKSKSKRGKRPNSSGSNTSGNGGSHLDRLNMDEEEDKNNLDELVSVVSEYKAEDLFTENDVLDLSGDEPADDSLVVIGRRTQVDLCISMIELSLQYVRKQRKREDRIRQLREKLRKVKGFDEWKPKEERDRIRQEREDQRQRKYEEYRFRQQSYYQDENDFKEDDNLVYDQGDEYDKQNRAQRGSYRKKESTTATVESVESKEIGTPLNEEDNDNKAQAQEQAKQGQGQGQGQGKTSPKKKKRKKRKRKKKHIVRNPVDPVETNEDNTNNTNQE